MTTLAELVQAQPAAGRGIAASYTHNGGGWSFVLELADPSAGSAVQWYDITALNNPRAFTGYDLTRGSDGYLGRYRASIANLDLYAEDDRLAPWHPDTSPLFGTHVELGPGLLIRAGFIRVSGGVVAEWLPRFTCKVQSWGDSSRSQGKVRTHPIVARDFMTSFLGIPLPPRPAENWSDRMFNWLVNSGWPYGSEVYGAQFTWDGNPILALPERPESSSAINELDTTLDPVGLVWYTDRRGVLIVRPAVDDTFHANAFLAGATGNAWPGDVTPVDFTWYACLPPDDPGEPTGAAAYAVDTDAVSPFGFDKSETNVTNHVRITVPGISPAPPDIFDEDDPISIQRYDRKTYQAGWLAKNDVVARQYLATRAHATAVARPLVATTRLTNFFPGPAALDYLGVVSLQHRNNDTGYTAWGNGWLRYYRERVFPHGCEVEWEMTDTFDLYSVSATAPSDLMRPVENLRVIGVSDWEVEVAWNNPPQTVIPTNTQIRMLPSELWSTTDYVGETADGLFWGGLAPSTAYEFQVRLIRIEDGVLTDFSPTRSLNFTTLATEDPFISVGDDINVDLPIPGAGCAMAWQLQSSPNGLAPWTNVVGQSGVITTPPFKFPINKAGLDPDLHYRVESEEFCAGISQGKKHSNVEPLQCLPVSKLGTPPYDDPSLVAFFPKLCPSHVEEAISGELVTLGPAFADKPSVAGIGPVLFSGDHDGVIGYGVQPLPAVSSSEPLTIGIRFKLGALPFKETRLFAYGGMGISLTSSGRLHGNVNEDGAGLTFISGATVLALNTEYEASLAHDPTTGNLRLYLGTAVESQALGTVGNRFNFGLYEINLPANSWITDMAVWDKVMIPGGGTLPTFDTSKLFTYTGAIQHFTVPAGVTVLKLTAEGSVGGGGPNPGKGARIIAIHPATPGQVLDLYVGGVQWPNGGNAGAAGAFGGSAGGASTDIRGPGGAFINAWLVAAGGGGAGEGSASNPNPFGGYGGFLSGGNSQVTNQAHGATQTAGGTGGPGGDGSFGQGGHALGSGNSFNFGSGGGGGGWYGGEGGVSGSPPAQSGGGGGSGHVDLLCTNVETFDGVVTTTGTLKVEWEAVTESALVNHLATTGPADLWHYVWDGVNATVHDSGSKTRDMLFNVLSGITAVAGPNDVLYPTFGVANDALARSQVEDWGEAYTTGMTWLLVYRPNDDSFGRARGGDAINKRKTGTIDTDCWIGATSTGQFRARSNQGGALNAWETWQTSVMPSNVWRVLEAYFPPGDSAPVLYREGVAVPAGDRTTVHNGVRGNNGNGLLYVGGNFVGGNADAAGVYAIAAVWMRGLSGAERTAYKNVADTEGWF